MVECGIKGILDINVYIWYSKNVNINAEIQYILPPGIFKFEKYMFEMAEYNDFTVIYKNASSCFS